MSIVTVNASLRYDILIENGCLAQCGPACTKLFSPTNTRVAIITDDIVSDLYLEQVTSSLKKSGYSFCTMSFAHGEDSKSHETLLKVYQFLIENQITRSDFIIALGGGVVGDLAGYAAATYLRGIAFVQIPTTFLAAIDSSVGGKTAINLPCGKNLIGAFHQPSLVLCDPETFSTLPPKIFADGCAEMIKYAMLEGENFMSVLEHCDISQNIQEIVTRCVCAKKHIVEQDEKDCGIRMVLNYGHTLGHAIEKASNHTVTHGQAVAIGMILITKIAMQLDLCNAALLHRLSALLERYHLPREYHGDASSLISACLNDKKRAGDKIRLILVSKPGNPQILPMPVDQFCSLIREVFAC